MSTKEAPANSSNDAREKEDDEKDETFGIVDALRILGGLVLLSSLVSYMIFGNVTWNFNPWWARSKALSAFLKGPIVLTDTELLAFAGQDESKPVYLALNGTIYDVTAGRRIYGPGGPYNFFAGRDAARAYITGCFKEDSVADWRGAEWTFIPKDVPLFSEIPDSDLSEQKRLYRYEEVQKGLEDVDGTIEHWAKVFRGETGKDYYEVGYVKREEGWIEGLELRGLCENAKKKRPKGRFEEGRVYKRPDRMARVRAVRTWQTEGLKSASLIDDAKEPSARDEL